tara:strand:+ start:335 stop:676 length:342 start_codon:yes stop_codon:yes gene_type:complete
MIKNKITLLDIEFHFGLGFLSSLSEGTGLAITDLSTQDDTVLMPKLMYYARKYAYDREGKEINFSMYDIYDLIDNNEGFGGSFWNAFAIAFSESMYKNVPVTEDKKKVAKIKK